jgi:hypothetical protein
MTNIKAKLKKYDEPATFFQTYVPMFLLAAGIALTVMHFTGK